MGQPTATAEAVTAAWRAESARLVAALVRFTGEVGLAEDLAQDALVAALEQWPETGIPANPGAWLTTTAKRRAVDHFRRAETLRRKLPHLAEQVEAPDLDAQVDFIEDDVLRLMFLCCHPTLTPVSRAALTLRLVAGLSTGEIARGFLVSETAMAQRISRAKRTLKQSRAEFELPSEAERRSRLDDVMAVVYLTFNEGYVAAAGSDWTRPDLCHEAIRLARGLTAMVPRDPEVRALLSLLELQASRLPARTDDRGRPVLLDDQDRRRWDHRLVRRGLAALERAEELARRGAPVGRYFLQAAIAGEHARAGRAEETDWPTIARLYDALAATAPGPVIEVNRAVAHGRAFGPGAGLALLDAADLDPLRDSPMPAAVRGDLLARLGRAQDAATLFRQAAELSANDGERRLLLRRAADVLRAGSDPTPGS